MSKNYYEILGVPKNATKDEIRRAYRELVKKYHPDKYRDNPLADLAQEKLKEINEAYDYLTSNYDQANHNQQQDTYQNSRQNYSSDASQGFQKVRSFIQTGNFDAAYGLLQTLDRNHADWYFLNGIISMNRGWYQNAVDQIQTAMRMSPGNQEYIAYWNSLNQRNYQYQAASRQRGYNNNDLCQLCTCLYFSDCCCECLGGNLIDCC